MTTNPEKEISCKNCEACCCRLEVFLLDDAKVPNSYIEMDEWGGARMLRLNDGFCAALDRNSMTCKIYALRPWVCREFVMGEYDCITERNKNR